MKKFTSVFLVVFVIVAVAIPILYTRGILWKKNLYITTPQRTCPVHKTILMKEMIRARTNRAITDPGPIQIEMDRLFPLKNNIYHGGHRPNVGYFEREYCSECREGAHKWYTNKLKAEQDAP